MSLNRGWFHGPFLSMSLETYHASSHVSELIKIRRWLKGSLSSHGSRSTLMAFPSPTCQMNSPVIYFLTVHIAFHTEVYTCAHLWTGAWLLQPCSTAVFHPKLGDQHLCLSNEAYGVSFGSLHGTPKMPLKIFSSLSRPNRVKDSTFRHEEDGNRSQYRSVKYRFSAHG